MRGLDRALRLIKDADPATAPGRELPQSGCLVPGTLQTVGTVVRNTGLAGMGYGLLFGSPKRAV